MFVILTLNNQRTLLNVVYIPPQSSVDFYERYCQSVEDVCESCNCGNIILCGDFNLPNIRWQNDEFGAHISGGQSPQSRILSDLIAYLNLNQLNNISNVYGDFLDLIFTNIESCNLTVANSILPCDAYHPSLTLSIPLMETLPDTINFDYEYFDFKNADYKAINVFFGSFDWDLLLECDITEALNRFYKVVNAALDSFVPIRKSRKPKFPLWYSAELKNCIFEKKIAHRKFKISKSENDYQAFSSLRRHCKLLSDQCYNEYISNAEESIGTESAAFWRYIHQRDRNSDLPNSMTFNSNSSQDMTEIVQYFADFFSSVYCDDACDTNVFNTPVTVSVNNCDMEIMDVFNVINSLKDHLSEGPDNISVLLLKNCVYILSFILCKIFNMSLESGIFPDVWKISYITPLYKNGDRSEISNYRAITKFSLVSKVFEKIVSYKLKCKLEGILTDYQHGFVRGRSTVTNLLTYEQFLIRNMENGNQIDAINMDFSKAFDRVNHTVLIKKLQSLGIFGNLLNWFKDYLTDRRQVVKVKNFQSHEIRVTSGVPQGAHLSPILFNMFINSNSNSKFKFKKYFISPKNINFC